MFQDYALFPHMSVTDNVAFGLRMRNVPAGEIAQRVADALDLVQLGGLGERRPLQLSGGQRQRVALARALVINPTVLLLDEPLSNLDLKLREEMRVEIAAIQRRLGITTVFVTHDQGEALVMSDRIAVMNAGRIEQIGEPADIYERPATRFVAEFIGRMNLFSGQVTPARRCEPREGLVIAVPVPAEIANGAAVHVAVRPERARLLREKPRSGSGAARHACGRCSISARRASSTSISTAASAASSRRRTTARCRSFEAGAAVWLAASFANCRVLPARS